MPDSHSMRQAKRIGRPGARQGNGKAALAEFRSVAHYNVATCAESHLPMIPARVLLAAVACAASLRAEAQVRDEHPPEEIVVTSERRAFQPRAVPASLGAIPADRIAAIGAQHPFELFTRGWRCPCNGT